MSTVDIPSRISADSVLWDYLNRLRRLEAVPIRGHYEFKVTADQNAGSGNLDPSVRNVFAGNGKFIFGIPDDLDQSKLTDCFAYVTTAGSSVIRIQLRYVAPLANPNTTGIDMLSTRIEIEAGEYFSYNATTQRVINASNRVVTKGGFICVDVDDAGGGSAEGLGVGIELSPPVVGSASV